MFRKELLDLLRDRRTLISLVIAPMLVGPVIMSVMNYYVRRSERQARVERYKVGIRETTPIAGLRGALRDAGLEVVDSPAPRQAVEKKEVTFGIDITGMNEQPQLYLFSDNSEMTANMARSRVNEAIDRVWQSRIRAELAARNLPENIVQPFRRASVNVARPGRMTGAFLGRLLGFLLLIFLFNGAMYAAVDATAGEKERRTLEILLSSAAGRGEIVTAKVLLAVMTSLGTTILSMVSYAFAFLKTARMPAGSSLALPVDPLTLSMLVILIIPVSLMAASVSFAAATPARSTREAMSYLTPGMFIVMFLGTLSFLVEDRYSTLLLMVPFANFSQMLRELISGDWSWAHYGLTVGANAVYSAAALALAARSFRRETILFRT